VGVQEPRGPAYTRRTKRGPGEIPCVRFDLALTGGGGEPVDLLRTLNSHGLIMLAPNARRDGDTVLRMPLRLADGRSTLAEIGPGPLGFARVTISGRLRGAAVQAELTALVRRILGLDEDLAPFYARAALDPALAWVTRGAGRFIRSASAFEDVVKTICTTNCAWSATIRMTDALVQGLGEPVTALPDKRLFPTPAAMAKASEAWYRDIARTGYRGPYLRAIAKDVAAGKLDLEGWAASTPATLGDAELEERLLALPGVGPYAAAHILMLMGRYPKLVLDSATRPRYARLTGRKPRSDATIVRRFKPYGRFAGLAFWCYVTRDWLDDSAEAIADRTAGSGSVS
jgi:3-methyladenine DNA glycosylase/8-oxoguanine DNA glycosylase